MKKRSGEVALAPGISLISKIYRDPIALKKNHKIATAGSCFSQALGQSLKEALGFMDMEPAPPYFETEAEARK